MTSKECLEKFRKLYETKTLNPTNTLAFIECYNIIKKDLEKLEQQTYQPTLDECIKEWGKRGWKVKLLENRYFITKPLSSSEDKYISIRLKDKQFVWLHVGTILSFEEVHLLSKTIKALEVENENSRKN